MTTYYTITKEYNEKAEELKNELYDKLIKLQNTCKHTFPCGKTAFVEEIDDIDYDGLREPTFDKWKRCEICNKYFDIKKRGEKSVRTTK